MQNCPDVTIENSILVFVLYFCLLMIKYSRDNAIYTANKCILLICRKFRLPESGIREARRILLAAKVRLAEAAAAETSVDFQQVCQLSKLQVNTTVLKLDGSSEHVARTC